MTTTNNTVPASRVQLALQDIQRPLGQVKTILRVVPQLTNDMVMKELLGVATDLLADVQVRIEDALPEEPQ